jgi:hypothetical protein
LLALCVLCAAGMFVLALWPRPDWYDGPLLPNRLGIEVRLGKPFAGDKLQHFAASAGLTLLLSTALHHLGMGRRAPLVAGCAIGIIWAGVIELLQGLVPYRDFELFDVLANLLGAGAAVLGWWWVSARWVRPGRL